MSNQRSAKTYAAGGFDRQDQVPLRDLLSYFQDAENTLEDEDQKLLFELMRERFTRYKPGEKLIFQPGDLGL